MLAFCGLSWWGNRRTLRKPPTLDGRPLPFHMPTLGNEPGPQRWQVRDIPLCYPWQIRSQFVCTVHVLGYYVLVSWKSLFILCCYGNINNYNWGKLKSCSKPVVRFQNNLAEMILISNSTKIAQAIMFREKLGTMNWGQFILHYPYRKPKNFSC